MRAKPFILYLLTVIVTLLLSFGLKRSFSSSSILYDTTQRAQFEMTDFYNSVGNYTTTPKKAYCNDVVVIGVDGCRIEEIPDIIETVESYSPKVIGVDILFGRHSGNVDQRIVDVIKRCRQIVVVAHIDENNQLETSPIFQGIDVATAADNLQEPIVRKYMPQFIIGDTISSFAMELVRCYDLDKYNKQLSRRKEMEHIHIYDFRCDTINYEQLLEGGGNYSEILKDKIVIIGACKDDYDQHNTTMNRAMPGAIIHSGIIYTILNEEYIEEYPWLHYLLAFIITAGFTWLMIVFRKKYSAFGNLMIRIMQIVLLLVGIYIASKCYIDGHLYLNLSVTLLSVGLVYIGYDLVFGINEFIHRTKELIKNKTK